jgi:hypothetical protein
MGKLAKSFSGREVAVDLGPDYDITEEIRLRVCRSRAVLFDEYQCWSNLKPVL